MFSRCAYGEAEDKEELTKLEKAPTKAVEFVAGRAGATQAPAPSGRKTVDIGGWGYVGAGGAKLRRGITTVTQLQALARAERGDSRPERDDQSSPSRIWKPAPLARAGSSTATPKAQGTRPPGASACRSPPRPSAAGSSCR